MAKALVELRDAMSGTSVPPESGWYEDGDELPFPLVRPRVRRVVPPALPSYYRRGAAGRR